MSADWTHIEYREPDWKMVAGAMAAGLAAAITQLDANGLMIPDAAAHAFGAWEQFTILPSVSAHPLVAPEGEP